MLRLRLFFYFSVFGGLILAGCTSQPTPTQEIPHPRTSTPTQTPTAKPSYLEAQLNPGTNLELFPKEQSVQVVFNQPMLPASSRIPLKTYPKLTGKYSWNPEHTVLTFEPSRTFQEGTTFTIGVEENLASASGQVFTTQPSWEIHIPYQPRVILPKRSSSGSGPYTGKHQVHPGSGSLQRRVGFEDRAPDPLSAHLERTGAHNPVRHSFYPGQKITLTLDKGAVAENGLPLDKVTWHYNTADVQATFEPSNAKNRKTTFRLGFNYTMDPGKVKFALKFDPPVDFTVAWDDQHKDALITTEPLNPGTSYTIRLEKIVSRAVEWTYQPPDLLESFERNPARIQKAPRKTPWIFNFNYAIDPKSFTQALRISPAVDYHVETSAGYSRFMIVPNQPLPSQTDYAIWFAEDLVDTGGSPLPALNPIRYTTPSPVSEFLPNDGSPLANIELFLDRDMDLQSTVAALTIQPPTDGTFEWEGAAHLVFHPNAGHLEEFTEYAISLAPTAKDA